MYHKNALVGDVHIMHNWEVSDQTALDALALVAGDIGKVARRMDTGDFYILKLDSPATWENMNPAVSVAAEMATLSASVAIQLNTQKVFANKMFQQGTVSGKIHAYKNFW